jgi:ribonuclease D
MGLNLQRDRLCVVQLSAGDGIAHIVHFPDRNYAAPNLRALLADSHVQKLFHFARFDLAMIQRHFGLVCSPVYCTKLASKLVRTNTERHGLKDLCHDLLGVELSKEQQTSDWGGESLTAQQLEYAAVAAPWPRLASASCRCALLSTWPAGKARIFLPTEANRRVR